MANVTELTAQLADPDSNKRRAAAEQLWLTPSLPGEAVFALKTATLDPDPAVAAAARAALAAHTNDSTPEPRPSAASAVFAPVRQPRYTSAQPAWKPKSDREARFAGGFFLLMGVVCSYFGIVRPIWQALNGAESVSYYSQATVFAGLGLILGVSMTVFGIKGWAFLQGPTGRWPRILFFAAVVLLTLACVFGMEYVLKSPGYG